MQKQQERGGIVRILVLELKDQDSPIFDKIMEVVKCCPDIEHIKIKDEPVLSLPGLEIYPGRRKIYRDRREINLTAKEYDLLSLLVANKGQVLTYDQIYRKVWGEDAFGDESNTIGAISEILGRNFMRQSRMRLLRSSA